MKHTVKYISKMHGDLMYALRTKVEYQRLQKHSSCSRGCFRDLWSQRFVYLNQKIGPNLVVLFVASYRTSRILGGTCWGKCIPGAGVESSLLAHSGSLGELKCHSSASSSRHCILLSFSDIDLDFWNHKLIESLPYVTFGHSISPDYHTMKVINTLSS